MNWKYTTCFMFPDGCLNPACCVNYSMVDPKYHRLACGKHIKNMSDTPMLGFDEDYISLRNYKDPIPYEDTHWLIDQDEMLQIKINEERQIKRIEELGF